MRMAYQEKVLVGEYTFKAPGNTVQCGDCQCFERAAHPPMGRCAKGHGRYWLWDSDKRQCEDFEEADTKAATLAPVKGKITN